MKANNIKRVMFAAGGGGELACHPEVSQIKSLLPKVSQTFLLM